MSEQPPEGVLGSLPRTRPHRRSAKRGPAAASAAPEAAAPPPVANKPPAAKPRPGAKPKPAAKQPAAGRKPTAAKKPAATKAPTTKAPTTKAPTTKGAPATPIAAAKASTPPRSLQSTAPRVAGARSRKPGATSQTRDGATTRPEPVLKRTAPPPAEPPGALGTAVQAAAELTEIGLKAGARALRGALIRLPHR